MRIVGFNFNKIEAERITPEINSKIQIASNISIKSIEQEHLEVMQNQPTLKINFEFSIDYKKNIARIAFHGFVLLLTDKVKSKQILKDWKSKKISDDIRLFIFNFILSRCNLRALQFEEEFALPSHIPMPKISPKPDEPDKEDNKDSNNTNYTG